LEQAGVPAGFRSGDVDDLREKLESLLQRPRSEREQLSRLARRVAAERWSWAHVAGRLLEAAT
ncbi:MAG: glycosyltransferase, partial [Actinomycetota bacterium]|nr:glycosyltransferase [Actinomycetota bacterium]